MKPNTSDTIENGEHNFIFAHRFTGTSIIYIYPPKDWTGLNWVTSSYAHVLTENGDYTPLDFALEIEKVYSMEEPHNAEAVRFLKKIETIKPFN